MLITLLILVYPITQALYSSQNSALSLQYDIANSINHILNNLTRIETELRDSQTSQATTQIIIAVVAAGGAVAGGFMASYVITRREAKKDQVESQKRKELNRKIKRLITIELQTYYDMLSSILKNSHSSAAGSDLCILNKDRVKEIELNYDMINKIESRYKQLGVERISEVFDKSSLSKIEVAYRAIEVGFEYQVRFSSFSRSKAETLSNLVEVALCSIIDE
jgi:uncharacterized membrane protein